jgi:hypothetical protein
MTERIALCANCSFDLSVIGILPLCGTATPAARRNDVSSRDTPESLTNHIVQC